jgi:predicted exporter
MSESREWVSFRIKPAEYESLEKLWKATTCRNMSKYARKVLLSKPVVIKYRSQSADQFLEEMILLKNELSAIGNNFNQAVKKLHTIDTAPQLRSWLIIYDATHQKFLRKTEEIKDRLQEIYELLSQKK